MKTMLLGINLLKPTIIDTAILLFAVGTVAVSLYLTSQFPDKNLFERSGSLVVLFAVIVEFRNFNLQQHINDKAAVSSGGLIGILIPTKQPRIRQFIIYTAHMFIIIGTVIWGYGGI